MSSLFLLRACLNRATNEIIIAKMDTIHKAIEPPPFEVDASDLLSFELAPFFTVVVGAGCSLFSLPVHFTTSPLSYV